MDFKRHAPLTLVLGLPLLSGVVYAVVKYFRTRKPRCQCIRNVGPCTVVLTGATSGIGEELLVQFMSQDCKVIIGARNLSKAKLVVERIRSTRVPLSGSIVLLSLDLSFFKSVRQFAHYIETMEDAVDLLVNCAAVYSADREMHLTVDGFEEHFQVNYLAPVLLSHLLMPLLGNRYALYPQRSALPQAKLVNIVSSLATRIEHPLDLDDINFAKTEYDPTEAYARSKYALVLYSEYLNERYTDLQVHAIMPGVVITPMHERRSPNRLMFALWKIFGFFMFSGAAETAERLYHICLCNRSDDNKAPVTMHLNENYGPIRICRNRAFIKQLTEFSSRCLLLGVPKVDLF